MKTLLLIFLLHSSLNYQLNIAKSEVKWTGYAAAGAYAPTGTIKVKSGSLSLADGQLKSAKVVMDMPTLSHEKEDMQTHLRGKDFFAVDKYPEATFVLTAVRGNVATGNLTIKGITNKISFPFTLSQENGIVTVKATVDIDRTKFGIKYNSASYFQDLGSYAIKNEFRLELQLSFD